MSWAVCAYSELSNLQQQGKIFAFADAKQAYISDFVNIYVAASLAGAACTKEINIYDPQVQAKVRAPLLGAVSLQFPFSMHYPPLFYTLVTPLGLLPMNSAWLCWCFIGLVLCLLNIWRLTDAKSGAFIRYFSFAAFLCSYPVWLSVKIGQTSLFLLPILATMWLSLEKMRNFRAGLVTALCMIKFQHLPLVLLSGAAKGRIRYLAGFLAMASAVLFLSIWQLGWHNLLNYPQVLLHAETSKLVAGVDAANMQNVRGQLVLLLGSDGAASMGGAAVVFLLALSLNTFMWWRKGQDISTRTFRLFASLTTLLLLVTSLHSHIQDYILAVIPCMWLWQLLDTVGNTRCTMALRSLILSFPVLSWLFFLLHNAFASLHIEPFFLWDLIVIALSCKIFAADLLAGRSRPLAQENDDYAAQR